MVGDNDASGGCALDVITDQAIQGGGQYVPRYCYSTRVYGRQDLPLSKYFTVKSIASKRRSDPLILKSTAMWEDNQSDEILSPARSGARRRIGYRIGGLQFRGTRMRRGASFTGPGLGKSYVATGSSSRDLKLGRSERLGPSGTTPEASSDASYSSAEA